MKFHETYKDQGLVIVAVLREDNRQNKASIEQFVKDKGIPYLVAIDRGGQTMQAYGIKGYPSSYLVGVDGQVIREQHGPSGMQQAIEGALQQVQLLPQRDLSEAFDGVKAFIKNRRWNHVITRVQKLLKRSGLSDDDRTAGEGLLSDIDEYVGAKRLEAVSALEADEEYFKARRELEKLKEVYKGLGTAEAAGKRLKEYRRDRDIKKLLKAGEYMAKAEDMERMSRFKEAAILYQRAAKAAKGTNLADRAEGRAYAAAARIQSGR